MNFRADRSPTAPNQTPNVGELGEQVVAGWLQTQGWVILHQRWRSRWGEIDAIAQRDIKGKEKARENSLASLETNQQLELPLISPSPHPLTPSPLIAFVEVKTRSSRNWDAGGLLAITPQKQAKLWKTAELFLAEYPELANFPCRFDVALVSYQRVSQRSRDKQSDRSVVATDSIKQGRSVQLGQPIVVAGYRLILHDYIESAFQWD